MKIALLITFISLSFRILFGQEKLTVAGRLYNEESKQPVPYANIVVKNTFIGTTSDENGSFSLQLEAGDYTLQIFHVVYYEKEVPISLKQGKNIHLSIALNEKTEQLGVITVQARRDAAPSGFYLKPYSVINAPAIGEPDVVRVAAMLPGITQINDYKAELNIRGGHADQNQFILDGVEVFNPQHVMGMFSAFNLWAVEDIRIYTARFPAEYSGRLSGVISLNSKMAQKKPYTRAHLSLLSSGIALTRKWNKTGLLFAARRTYLDLATKLFGGNFPFNFYDINLKLTQNLTDAWKISAIGFLNTDRMDADPSLSKWGNRMAALKLYKQRDGTVKKMTLFYTGFFSSAEEGGGSSFINNDFNISGLLLEYRRIFSKTIVRFGLSFKKNQSAYKWYLQGNLNADKIFYPGAPQAFNEKQSTDLMEGWYGQDFLFLPRFPLTIKLRYILQDYKQSYLAPGLFLDWQILPRLTVTSGAERTFQFFAAGSEALEFNAPSPLFITDKPLSADLFTLGAVWQLGLDYQLKSELFYKNFHSLVKLNASAGSYPAFLSGSGRAYGADIVFEKLRGRITFQFAYSYLSALLWFNNVSSKPNWDVPHAFKGLVGFRFGRTWLFNAAFTYRSGNLYQNALAMFYASGATGDRNYSRTDFNLVTPYFILENTPSTRFNPYTRLDLALRKKYKAKHFDWTLYIQVQNITFADNPLRIDFRERYFGGTPNQDEGITMSIPILPSVGAEFEF